MSYNADQLSTNQSYGCPNDIRDSTSLLYFPIPGEPNSKALPQEEINFSHEPGFYPSSFLLSFSCVDSVYYTLDGSLPSLNSKLYSAPISISDTGINNFSLIPATPFFPYEDYSDNEYAIPPIEEKTKGIASSFLT